jgi:hypothetical protein
LGSGDIGHSMAAADPKIRKQKKYRKYERYKKLYFFLFAFPSKRFGPLVPEEDPR